MMSTCVWQLENPMAQHRDPLPSTEADEPVPKTTGPGHVSHTVSPASSPSYVLNKLLVRNLGKRFSCTFHTC